MSFPAILMYHSIDNRNGRSDVWDLSVSPDNFASQIEALVSEREVVPLEEMGRCVRAGHVPERHVAITFDDGYANNLAIAKPILERYRAPATVFLMTSAFDRLCFWWDRLERIVMEADTLPPTLSIPLPDRKTLEIMAGEESRTKVLFDIWSRLRELAPDDREQAIAHLAGMLHVQAENRALRPLATSELQQLDGVISVGAHTHSHPSLPRLDGVELLREIADSKTICESLLNRRITTFAYPFGDYDDKVRSAVAEAGLTLACTTAGGPVQAGGDCLTLPRIAVNNWDGETLIRSLQQDDRFPTPRLSSAPCSGLVDHTADSELSLRSSAQQSQGSLERELATSSAAFVARSAELAEAQGSLERKLTTLSAALDARSAELAEAQGRIGSLERKLAATVEAFELQLNEARARFAAIEQGPWRHIGARLRVRLNAALRHPANSSKRKIYRSRHIAQEDRKIGSHDGFVVFDQSLDADWSTHHHSATGYDTSGIRR